MLSLLGNVFPWEKGVASLIYFSTMLHPTSLSVLFAVRVCILKQAE